MEYLMEYLVLAEEEDHESFLTRVWMGKKMDDMSKKLDDMTIKLHAISNRLEEISKRVEELISKSDQKSRCKQITN
jgi:hypothetical protein